MTYEREIIKLLNVWNISVFLISHIFKHMFARSGNANKDSINLHK